MISPPFLSHFHTLFFKKITDVRFFLSVYAVMLRGNVAQEKDL